MRRAWDWLAHHQFVAAVLVFTVIIAAAFTRDYVREQRDRQRAECVAAWADEFTARTSALTAAGNLRADALDTVLRNVFDQIATGRSDPAAFRQRLADYVTASDTYKASQVDNPVPDPPRIRC